MDMWKVTAVRFKVCLCIVIESDNSCHLHGWQPVSWHSTMEVQLCDNLVTNMMVQYNSIF